MSLAIPIGIDDFRKLRAPIANTSSVIPLSSFISLSPYPLTAPNTSAFLYSPE
jgi:hypothetical protein